MTDRIPVWVATFQSPSLRGSGRFEAATLRELPRSVAFQSPSLRGSGRFRRAPGREARLRGVSIPFIAGQWSLRARTALRGVRRAEFQSPSLRGSGRFETALSGSGRRSPVGFNPLHCGAVVASLLVDAMGGFGSILFQSPSLRGSGRFGGKPPPRECVVTFQSPSLRGSGRFSRPDC